VTPDEVIIEAGRLLAAGESYALATVVRVRRPASTRRGDRALVLPDGRLRGWVGGSCSEPVVVREALRALAAGEARMVRIGPASELGEGGVDVVATGCASEGSVDVLIEPAPGKPLVAVIGDSPAARTLADLAGRIGWRVTRALDPGAEAVVIAAMGRGDEETLQAALAGPAGYVGLVASARRAAAVLATLRDRGVGEEALARVRSPAGLDLGPVRQEEIAVAVLAELVAWRHARPPAAVDGAPPPVVEEAVDPVCGMTVVVRAGAERAVVDGAAYYFCCAGCRAAFEADPARYTGSASSQ
jgi:xanthine dehydrogenase accessory factor